MHGLSSRPLLLTRLLIQSAKAGFSFTLRPLGVSFLKMYTLKASLIDPFKRKSRITCSKCELSYKARNYSILYDSEKLAYFKFKPMDVNRYRVFCHDCLHKACLKSAKAGYTPLKVDMHTLDGVVTITIVTEE